MAFAKKSLVRLSTQAPVGDAAGNPTQPMVSAFIYATVDAAATLETAGYFNNARNTLQKGDIILASMVNGGTPVLKPYVATAVPASGNVTVALGSVTAG